MEAKKRIIKTLKDFGKMPTSRIGAISGIDYKTAKDKLEELKKEGKVEKIDVNTATYWKLKEKRKKNDK